MGMLKKVQKYLTLTASICLLIFMWRNNINSGQISDISIMALILILELRYLGSKVMGEFD